MLMFWIVSFTSVGGEGRGGGRVCTHYSVQWSHFMLLVHCLRLVSSVSLVMQFVPCAWFVNIYARWTRWTFLSRYTIHKRTSPVVVVFSLCCVRFELPYVAYSVLTVTVVYGWHKTFCVRFHKHFVYGIVASRWCNILLYLLMISNL